MRGHGPSLKERVATGHQVVGAILRMPAESLVEMCGLAGLDYVIIDCEHGPADLIALQTHLAAADSVGMETLVRVPGGEPGLVLRCLDLGASGIVVPQVESAGDASAAVAAAHYPPLGARGFATYTRAGEYGKVAATDHLAAAGRRTLVIPMVETAKGVANAAEILSADGVDGVLVGPADLSVSLGIPGQTASPPVQDAIAAVHAEAGRQGVAVMQIVGDVDGARSAAAQGSQFIVYNLAQLLTSTLASLTDLATHVPTKR